MTSHLAEVSTRRPMRVAIADDSPLLIDGVARALGDGDAVHVVARATSGQDLLSRVNGRHADAIIIDPWLSSGDGLEAIAALSAAGDAVTIIAFSGTQQAAHVDQALANGADGYIGKDIPASDLGPLVRRVCSGILVRPRALEADGPAHALTRRERDVLALVADGMTNQQAARHLFVTEQTVKFHLGNVYRKLGAANRTEAARHALSLGLVR